jgi:preprotein translocase subunit SecG
MTMFIIILVVLLILIFIFYKLIIRYENQNSIEREIEETNQNVKLGRLK